MSEPAHDLAPEEDEDGIDGPWERAMESAIRADRAPRRVVREQRVVYRVPGGRSRFTPTAAYREAARVAIREACSCAVDGDGWNEPHTFSSCRFHGARVDGFAFGHPGAAMQRETRMMDHPGEAHGLRGEQVQDPDGGWSYGDGGRAYYTLVRERLARWLRWADTHGGPK